MAGYWNQVARRALSDARKTLKIETREAVVLLILGQAILAVFLWLSFGDAGLPARIGAASLPFILLAPVFILRFIQTPPRMHAELAKTIAGLEARPNTIKDGLERIYITLGEFQRTVVTQENVDSYIKSLNACVTSQRNWIRDNIGIAASEKFLDTTRAPVAMRYGNAVSDDHNSAILALNEFRKNVSSMIDLGVWR